VGRGVPIKQVAEDAGHIHGADGMGNLSHTLPPATQNFEDARYWDEIIIDELNANPGEISIISGPVTNLFVGGNEKSSYPQKSQRNCHHGRCFLLFR
jgi:inosine-uridine nucleoside N-ribohydrolase